jgi:hypothetical protein
MGIQMNRLISHVMGKKGSLRRFFIAFVIVIGAVTTWVWGSDHMTWIWWPITFIWVVILFSFIWLQSGGWKLFKCWWHSRKVRALMTSLARPAGATVESKANDFMDKLYFYYRFPDGQCFILETTDTGVMNIHSPRDAANSTIQAMTQVFLASRHN